MPDFSKIGYEKTDQGFLVCLEGRPLKTHGRRNMLAPNEKLAAAIAAEWRALEKEVDWGKLPLSNRLGAVLDGESSLEKWRDDLLSFAKNDLLCYFAAFPKELAEIQEKYWLPLVKKINSHLSIELTFTQGIIPVKQPDASILRIKEELERRDLFAIFVMRSLAGSLGSFILAYAVMQGWVGAQEAFSFSMIDEEWQEEQWGSDDEAVERRRAICDEIIAVYDFYALLTQQ